MTGDTMLSRFFSWLWRDTSVLADETPPRLGKTQVLILVLIALLGALFAARVLLSHKVDSDTLWHIRTGQWIVENGTIPDTDVFSWIGVERGLSWTPHEWLFDIVLWAVYSTTSFAGVYALTSLTYGAFVLLVFLLAYRRSGAWTGSLIISVVSMLGVVPFLAPRPQVATYALLALVALLLEMRRPYLAFVAMVLGINVHGAMYPVYVGLFAFYCLPRRDWKPLLLAVLGTVMTPLTTELLAYPLFAFDSQVTLFQEYAPTVLTESWVLLIAFIAIFLFVRRDRVPVWDGLLVLVLSLLALTARRHATLFFGIAWPMLAPYLSFGVSDPAERSEKETGSPDGEAGNVQLDRALAVILLVAVGVSGARIWGATIDPDRGYPADAVTWIEEEGLTRVWNDWGDGGYLIYRGVPTFVDGRADPFSPFFDPDVTIASDVAKAHYVAIDPREVVEEYGIHYVLVRSTAPMYQVLAQSRYFDRLYSDDSHAVFATTEAPRAAP